jgi:Tol biopolymer transport system component/DNA-binding winged helix-turn-helix (wHTH) protein
VFARFDRFQVDLSSGELLRSGERVPIQEQPFQVLRLLLEAEGRVVTREELRAALWPEDTFVDFERGVNTAVKKVRQALEDSADSPRFVETLPKIGYRFMVPVAWAPDAGKVSPQVPMPDPQPIPRVSRWKWKAAIAVVACAAVGGVLYLWFTPRVARLIRLYQLQQLTVVPLTALPGNVASPTFSPDGSQVAFAWDGENNGAGFDLYVKAIGTERPLRLTHHPAIRLSAAWSPDGRSIAISRVAGEDDTGIYLLPPTGGPERKLASRSLVTFALNLNEISWSPDGKLLAYIDHPPGSPDPDTLWVFLLTLDNFYRKEVNTGCDGAFAPSFSPRGDFLAWVCAHSTDDVSLNLQRLSDGSTRRLFQRRDGIGGIAWSSDGRRIVFSAPFDLGDLWEVSPDRPHVTQKLPVGHDASDLAVSRSGTRLAYVQGLANVNIWRLDLSASPAKAQQLVTSSRQQEAPSLSPDSSKIAFESNRTGPNEVWVSDADGSNPVQLTSFGISATGTPRWSPDGKLIAFDSRISGEANIYLVHPQGGAPRRLEVDIRGNSLPSWSHDGNWIYFVNGGDAFRASVWRVPPKGGHAVQVTQAQAFYPLESPDGQYVYFVRDNRLWRVRTDGIAEQAVNGMPELSNIDEWFPSGSGIYFMSHSGAKAAIEFFDLKTEKVRRVYELQKPVPGWIGGMPVSSDGRRLFFPQLDEQSSNLMLIENWQ